MYKEGFASRLKKARERTGLTQREVCTETNISQPSLAQYETGQREPSIETIGILSEFYQVSTDWLFGVKIDKTENKKEDFTTEKNRKEILKQLG